MPHVFISYVRENQEQVDRLMADLKANGVDVWLDRDRILPGQRWRSVTRAAIREGSFFLACFSRESQSRDRAYMNEELNQAIEELRRMPRDQSWFIPVLLSGTSIPDLVIGGGETLSDLHWADLRSDWKAGIAQIVKVIQQRLVITSSPRPEPNKVDGFAVKIASLNTLAFSCTAAAVTYVDARLKTHLAFGARHYSHGYQISLLGGAFVWVTTLLVFGKLSSWRLKAVLPAILLALAGALSLPFFRPEYPHGGISIWIFAFSVISLFTCFVHLLPLQAEWLVAPEVSTATKVCRAKDSAALWRIIAILITIAYIVLLIPWATFIWNQSPHIVADPGESFLLSEFGVSGILGCSVYMLLGVIYESFRRSLDAGDLALRIKAQQPRGEANPSGPDTKIVRDRVFISYSRKDRILSPPTLRGRRYAPGV